MELQELNTDSSVETLDKKDTKNKKGKTKNIKRKFGSVEDDDNDVGDGSHNQDASSVNGEISSKKKKKKKSKADGQPRHKDKKEGKPSIKLRLSTHFKQNKKLGERLKLADIQELMLHCMLRQSARKQLNWCHVEHIKKIKKVIVILLRSVGENDFAQHVTSFPFITQELSSCAVPTNVSGTEFTFKHVHETLLSVPLSKTQQKKRLRKNLKEGIKDNGPAGDGEVPGTPLDKSVFLLTKDQLKSNKYPVRCYDEKANNEEGFLPCVSDITPVDSNSDEPPVFAVDCEMCVTSEGYELTRISIIDESMNMLYDTLVKPDRPILDYKTKYSGITAESLEGITITLQDVQKQVTALLPPGAILAGHSLDCDLNALKMYHDKVIDTAVSYKDKRGGYFKPSLKFLAEFYLQKKIQNGSNGHCSIEDAKTCMELVKLKFQEGPNFGLVGNESEGLFNKMDSEKKKCKNIKMYMKLYEKNSPPHSSLRHLDRSTFISLQCKGMATFQDGAVNCEGDCSSKDLFLQYLGGSMLDYPYIANMCKSGGHHVVPCTSDSEIVLKAANHIESSDFTWIHLHAVQHFYERLKNNAMNEEKKEEVLMELDSRVHKIYQDIPENCLTLVIMGCGDVRQILRLQRDPNPRTEELRKAVKEAKKGLCFMKFT